MSCSGNCFLLHLNNTMPILMVLHAEKAHLRFLLWNSEHPSDPLYLNPPLILLLTFGMDDSPAKSIMCEQMGHAQVNGTFLDSDKSWAAFAKKPSTPATADSSAAAGTATAGPSAAATAAAAAAAAWAATTDFTAAPGGIAASFMDLLRNKMTASPGEVTPEALAAMQNVLRQQTPSPAPLYDMNNRLPPRKPAAQAAQTAARESVRVPSRVRSTPACSTSPLAEQCVSADANLIQLPFPVVELADLQGRGCVACGAVKTAAGARLLGCSGCMGVFYCCREHQRRDWEFEHKQV